MKTIAVLFLAIVLLSCEKDKNNEKSLLKENVSTKWLQDLQKSISECNCNCQLTLFRGQYSGETVYFVLMNDPVCNSIFGTELYNTAGQIIKAYNYNEQEQFSNEVKIDSSIYVCKTK